MLNIRLGELATNISISIHSYQIHCLAVTLRTPLYNDRFTSAELCDDSEKYDLARNCSRYESKVSRLVRQHSSIRGKNAPDVPNTLCTAFPTCSIARRIIGSVTGERKCSR